MVVCPRDGAALTNVRAEVAVAVRDRSCRSHFLSFSSYWHDSLWKRFTSKAKIKPRSAAVKADVLPLARRGDAF